MKPVFLAFRYQVHWLIGQFGHDGGFEVTKDGREANGTTVPNASRRRLTVEHHELSAETLETNTFPSTRGS